MPPKPENANSMLSKIRNSIFGKQNYSKIATTDDIIKSISDELIKKDPNTTIERLRTSVTKHINSNVIKESNSNIIEDKNFIDRISRYRSYEEIEYHIPHCRRALNVLTDGVLSPDDLSKETLQVWSDSNDDESGELVKEIKQIIKTLKIDRILNTAIKECLRIGDSFVEIIDYTSKDIPITQTILNESNLDDFDDIKINIYNENGECHERLVNLSLIATDNDEKMTESIFNDNDEKIKVSKMEHIKVIRHEPHTVIKLQTSRYKFLLGYLVLPKFSKDPSKVSQKRAMSSTAFSSGLHMGGGTSGSDREMSGVDSLYKSIFKHISKMTTDKLDVNQREIKDLLYRAVKEIDSEDKSSGPLDLEIRFVPSNRMVHFYKDNTRYFPYGESIFESVEFQAKVLMALQIATTIKRLSDSTDKRIVEFDYSPQTRDARTVLESIKSELNKQKISISNLGTVAEIPSMMNTYEVLYVPRIKDKPYISFSRLEPSADLRSMTEDLKLFRDFLISSLDVPPAYLNLEDGASSKTALPFENALFAETILGYQYNLQPCVEDLISKIHNIIKGRSLPLFLRISFPPPKMLQIERESERVDFGSRIVQALKELGCPVDFSKKLFLPQIPWNEIEQFKSIDDLNKKVNNEPDDNQLISPGGGYGQSY